MNTTAPVKTSSTRPSNWQRYIDLLGRERISETVIPDLPLPRRLIRTDRSALDRTHIEGYPSHLATVGKVAASTQNQALNVLLLFYK